MHRLIVPVSWTPSTRSTVRLSCASVRPAVPCSGWAAKSARLTAQNASGDDCATQAAALAARREYFVPCDRFDSVATGWMSTVAAPESTRPSMYARFVFSNAAHSGQR